MADDIGYIVDNHEITDKHKKAIEGISLYLSGKQSVKDRDKVDFEGYKNGTQGMAHDTYQRATKTFDEFHEIIKNASADDIKKHAEKYSGRLLDELIIENMKGLKNNEEAVGDAKAYEQMRDNGGFSDVTERQKYLISMAEKHLAIPKELFSTLFNPVLEALAKGERGAYNGHLETYGRTLREALFEDRKEVINKKFEDPVYRQSANIHHLREAQEEGINVSSARNLTGHPTEIINKINEIRAAKKGKEVDINALRKKHGF